MGRKTLELVLILIAGQLLQASRGKPPIALVFVVLTASCSAGDMFDLHRGVEYINTTTLVSSRRVEALGR